MMPMTPMLPRTPNRPLTLAALALAALLAAAPQLRAATLSLTSGDNITFNTSTATYSGTVSGSGTITGGVANFAFDAISLPTGVTVTLTGSNPLELSSTVGGITLGTTLNLSGGSGAAGTSGVGGAGKLGGANGVDPNVLGNGPGAGGVSVDGCCTGGGGGSFGGLGGAVQNTPPARPGALYSDSVLTYFTGGSSGGGSGNSSNQGGSGAGGGALWLNSVGSITLTSTGQILANGGDGSNTLRGGAAGSGGAVKLVSSAGVSIDGLIETNGGSTPVFSPVSRTGGGGGGGRIAVIAPTLTLNSISQSPGNLASGSNLQSLGGSATPSDFGGLPGSNGTIRFSPTASTGNTGTGATSLYAQTVLAAAPTTYLRLDESSGTVAAKTLGVDSYYSNSPTLATAGPRPSSGFNGLETTNNAPQLASASVQAIQGGGLLTPNNAFSIELFFKHGSFSGDETVFSGTSNNSFGILLDFESGNDIRFLTRFPVGPSGGTDLNVTSFGSLTPFDNNWHNLIASNDGSFERLYLDGTLIGSLAASSIPTGSNVNYVLGELLPTSTARPYQGSLDEFSFYDRALTPTEALNHYRAALGTIPEPTTLTLLALTTPLLLRRPRRR